MSLVSEKAVAAAPGLALEDLELAAFARRSEDKTEVARACFHCGELCRDGSLTQGSKFFCCHGCLAVHDILAANGLEHFYELAEKAGTRTQADPRPEQWAFLDTPSVQQQLLDFTDGNQSRIRLRIPAIHCMACVWLLENLFRLHPGIGESQVNFPRRELSIRFAPKQIQLSKLVALLSSIGYEPQLSFGEKRGPVSAQTRRRWLQVGVAGFAFGNIMLFSIPLYLGLDSLSGAAFQKLFGYLSLALALPVLIYSAADYWKGAALSARQRMLTLDVPIALGLAALYLQSAVEILSGRGGGYLDSLAGLIFFLLCGRAFQQKTFERMAFDRDYKSFFPLATLRKTAQGEEATALSQLRVGDRLVIRHGELIPADSTLIQGNGVIDYSFVSGESEPVNKGPGEHLYAGGKQGGGSIEIEMVRPISQSYLASLWDHQAFRKSRGNDLNTLTNRYSRRFTRLVIAIAVGAALCWTMAGAPGRGLKAFTSVLIVACPCALALAAPFALGTVQRLLARLNIFVKNTVVLERLAQVDTLVFDKTGTLTSAGAACVEFCAAEENPVLDADEQRGVAALTGQSTHPSSRQIHQTLAVGSALLPPVTGFCEIPGRGLEAEVEGRRIQLGAASWLESQSIEVGQAGTNGSVCHLAIDNRWRGLFRLSNAVRPNAERMLEQLATSHELALLSGDNERERERFRQMLGPKAKLHFNQAPLAKLEFIQRLQDQGRTVLMAGDGLNDAGALKQSDVGIAVVEKVGAFSPASDVILEAGRVSDLEGLLRLARGATKVVRLSFGVSALYNAVGIGIAAAGVLSPLICAVLMPLSSISVVLFACGAANWTAKRAGFSGKEPALCR